MKDVKTVYIILAFCIGLFFGHLFFPSGNEILPPAPGILQTQAKVNKIDSTKSAGDSLLKVRNRFLSRQLLSTNALLQESRSDLAKQRNKLFALAKEMAGDTTVREKTEFKDSLDTELSGLNSITDSLICEYEQKISLTESIVAVRDSELVICERSYNELRDVIKEQSLREQKLTDDLNTALRQQKRTRLQNKLLAVGMLFISGVTTSLIVKARQ